MKKSYPILKKFSLIATPAILITLACIAHDKPSLHNIFHPGFWHYLGNYFILPSHLVILVTILFFSLLLSYVLEKLNFSHNQLDITYKITENTHDAIVITDKDTNITYVNKAYENITGYSYKEIVGTKVNLFEAGSQNTQFIQNIQHHVHTQGQWEGILWDKKRDGQLYIKQLTIVEIKNKQSGQTERYVGFFNDISINGLFFDEKHKKSIQPQQKQMLISNESMIINLLSKIITVKTAQLTIVYLTIENFNRILNIFDEDCHFVHKIFSNMLRPLIHPGDFIAQTGRNLFAIVLNLNADERPSEFISHIHKNLSKVTNIKGHDIFFKTRIGATSCWTQLGKTKTDEEIKELLSHAMVALEWAGKHENEKVAFFNKSMLWQLNKENKIEGMLRKAIQNKELSIVYQPQIHIQTEKIVGMEALVRWHNAVLGNVSPAVFIPIAEKNQLMVEIGDWILQKVCFDINLMKQQPNMPDQLKCAVNISALQIAEEGFSDTFLNYVDTYDIQSHEIEFEITETSLLKNKTQSIEILNKVRDRGISIAIDDFGTGYSSLSYLNTLPVDKIKIDRSFIKDYPQRDNGSLANILVNMSKTLRKKVLTEGAETQEQIDYLHSIGCEYIQGFFYSKPLPLDEFISYAKKHI